MALMALLVKLDSRATVIAEPGWGCGIRSHKWRMPAARNFTFYGYFRGSMASLLRLQYNPLLAQGLRHALLDWLKAAQPLQILPDLWRKDLLHNQLT